MGLATEVNFPRVGHGCWLSKSAKVWEESVILMPWCFVVRLDVLFAEDLYQQIQRLLDEFLLEEIQETSVPKSMHNCLDVPGTGN